MNAAEMLTRHLFAPDGIELERAKDLVRIATTCPRVDIQNVISMADNHAAEFDYDKDSLLPPWKEATLFFTRDGARVGLSIHRKSLTPERRSWYCERMTPNNKVAITPGPGHVFMTDILFGLHQNSYLLFVGTIFTLLDEQGVYDCASFLENSAVCSNSPQNALRHVVDNCAVYTYTAFALCHCRNVQVSPAPVSRQIRRWAERHKEPVFEHHIIQITGKTPLHINGSPGSRGTNSPRALHKCRGHFAHYGAQWNTGKLFGKIEGRFYIDEHDRGSLKEGVITKDYKV